jgi:hypothetical protein
MTQRAEEARAQDNAPLDPIRALLDHIGEPVDGVWPTWITRDLDTEIIRRARAAYEERDAYAARRVAEERERAAKIADDYATNAETPAMKGAFGIEVAEGAATMARYLATAIRSGNEGER